MSERGFRALLPVLPGLILVYLTQLTRQISFPQRRTDATAPAVLVDMILGVSWSYRCKVHICSAHIAAPRAMTSVGGNLD